MNSIKRLSLSLVIQFVVALLFGSLRVVMMAQSVPVGQLSRAAEVKHAKTPRGRALTLSAGETDCKTKLNGLSNWFPLAGKDDPTVVCFYQTSGTIEAISQVGFLYGFGGGDSKTLTADLMSVQFPGGLQATLGQSVTMGTSTTTSVTTITTPSTGPPTQSTTQQTMDTPATAIDKLEQGGDIFVKFQYPLLYGNGTSWGGSVFAVPKVAGNFSGFGSEATITQANEFNINFSLESYGEWRGIGDNGLLYADIRSGWQYVQPEFAQKIGLGTNNFLLTQFAAGIEFAKLARFGFQRFVGPAPAFGVTQSELSKWHLVLQLVPKPKKNQ